MANEAMEAMFDARMRAEERADRAERQLVAALAELGLQNAPCDAGEMVINSVRALLSSVRQAQARAEEAVRENDILRGMASRLMPCHYCGVDDMARCPRGFPGCGLADDLLAGEDTLGQVWKERAEKAEEAGYRRGIEAAIETAKQQRCRDEYPKTNREKISHERGCNGAIKRIRALLPPDTQTEEDV